MSDINTDEIARNYTGEETALLLSLEQIKTIKAAIKAAIESKGQNPTTFDTYAAAINAIETEKVDIDFTEIGYPNNAVYQKLLNGFAYAKTITDAQLDDGFENDANLLYFPLLDTSELTDLTEYFKGDKNLEEVPVLNTSAVTAAENMFEGCISLSENALNNILAMATASGITGDNKTLKYLGLNFFQAEVCKTLSNWSAFETAGWTSGLSLEEDIDTEIAAIIARVAAQDTELDEMIEEIDGKTSAVAQESEAIVDEILGENQGE